MVTDPSQLIAPAIAKALQGEPGERADECRPSFLNWAIEETDRLRESITAVITQEARFQIQNRIATIGGTAHGYGQWIYSTAHY